MPSSSNGIMVVYLELDDTQECTPTYSDIVDCLLSENEDKRHVGEMWLQHKGEHNAL